MSNPQSPRTYYLTIEHGWASRNTLDQTYTPHFTHGRSFGPYTLKGATRLQNQVQQYYEDEPSNVVRFRVYPSGAHEQITRTSDGVLYSLITKITNNYSPITPTKGSPLNYV